MVCWVRRRGLSRVLLDVYNQIYFSLYERPSILSLNPFRSTKSIVELGRENVLGQISRSLFIGGGVTYPSRDEVLLSLQVPTGDWETDRHMRALEKCVNNLTIQKFRSLTNWIFHCVCALFGGSASGSCLRLPGLKSSKENQVYLPEHAEKCHHNSSRWPTPL